MRIWIFYGNIVSYPYCGFNADPDPAFYLSADLDPDPDSGSKTNPYPETNPYPDPDPGQTFPLQKVGF